MSVYTIKFFDQRGQVAHERSLECDNDDEAIERLALLRHAWALELWRGGALVWRFDSGPFMGGAGLSGATHNKL